MKNTKNNLVDKRQHGHNNQHNKSHREIIGDFPGYIHPVWYHPNATTNTMASSYIDEHYQINYDNQKYLKTCYYSGLMFYIF